MATAILTNAQKVTLRAAIEAVPALDALADAQEWQLLADALNANASPNFFVWKTKVSKHEVTDLAAPAPFATTTFTWGGTQGGYIARSQGERDCWVQIWNTGLTVNPSLPNVRAAFDDIFSGAGTGAVNNRAHISAMCKRLASVMEKVFATGTGSEASPGLLGVEGTMQAQNMGEIMAAVAA